MQIRISTWALMGALLYLSSACARVEAGFGADDSNSETLAASGQLVGPSGLTGFVYHMGADTSRQSPPTFQDVTAQLQKIATLAPSSAFVCQPAALNQNIAMSGGDGTATRTFIGSCASGWATTDANQLATTAIDFLGYVYFPAAGTYTFTLGNVDDAAAVYINGTGVSGSGTLIAANTYTQSKSGPGSYKATQAGWARIELFWYNQIYNGGGGGAQLNFSMAGPQAPQLKGLMAPEGSVSGTSGLLTRVYHRGSDASQPSPPTVVAIGQEIAYMQANQPSYTFTDTTFSSGTTQTFSGGDATQTKAFLGTHAVSAAAGDTAALQTTLLDFSGAMRVTKAGAYTVSLTNADDAAALWLSGTGAFGSGILVAERNYNASISTAPGGVSPQPIWLLAGDYPVELFYYNQAYASNQGGAGLSIGVTGPAAVSFVSTAIGSMPSPTPTPTPTAAGAGASLAVQEPTFDGNLPMWPVTYSDADKQAQRTAGTNLTQAIGSAISSGQSSYTLPAGVYRISSSIILEQTHNFTLHGNGAEIIAENDVGHFRLLGNTNLVITGPLTLDGDPFGFTQGTIVGTDGATYIDMQVMPGYPAPSNTGRFMFFAPSGVSLRHFEDRPNSVTSMGNGIYRLNCSSGTFNYYQTATLGVIKVGNLILMDGSLGSNGGFEMRNNVNVTMTDVSMYTSALTWALPEQGNDVFQRFHGTRRPGTNRLGAGGWMQMGFEGGSFTLLDSELAYNLDDLTDIGGAMGYAYKQASNNTIYAGLGDAAVGLTLTFTDYNSLNPMGQAKITAIATVTDQNLINAYTAQLDADNILHNQPLQLFTLDRAVTLAGFSIIDVEEFRPRYMTVQNTYIHDGLAAGLNLKGALKNTVIERTGYRGVGVNYDPYWWEGGIPQHVQITNNTIRNVPYWLYQAGASIDVSPQQTASTALGTPIAGVSITYNLVVNPQIEGINVGNANSVVIGNNVIQNPVADQHETAYGNVQPYPHAAAITLDVVGPGTQVSNNACTMVNSAYVTNTVWMSSRTQSSNVISTQNTSAP